MAIERNPSTILAPRNDVELRLLEIWTQVLERSSFGVTDNFYDLGGDSLRAVNMIADVESEFCVGISPAQLYDAATIEKLAQVVGASSAGRPAMKDPAVVELRKANSRLPLFCFPGNCGGVFPFYPVSERLDPERGVYVVSYSYLDRNIPLPSMKGLAASCLEGIRTVQPAGPYHLGGYCFGASVAYEAARQLRAAGEEVALLALFDPELGTKPWSLRKKATTRAMKFAAWIRSFFEGAPPPASTQEVGQALQARIARYQMAALSIHKTYRHRACRSPLSVFYAAEGGEDEHLPYWQRLAKAGMENFSIPGNHWTMLQEPNVSHLAEILQSRFRDHEPKSGDRPVVCAAAA